MNTPSHCTFTERPTQPGDVVYLVNTAKLPDPKGGRAGRPTARALGGRPARRRTVVRGLDLDTAVQVHGTFAELVIAERLERQRQ